MDAYYAT
jgi:hypothetical protein